MSNEQRMDNKKKAQRFNDELPTLTLNEAAKRPLTVREKQIYEYSITYVVKEHNFPTAKAIAKKLKLRGDNSVKEHLRSLLNKGYIEKLKGHKPYKITGLKLSVACYPKPKLTLPRRGGP